MHALASAQARVEEQSVILLELNANVRRCMEVLECAQQQAHGAEGARSPPPAAACASAAIPAVSSGSASARAAAPSAAAAEAQSVPGSFENALYTLVPLTAAERSAMAAEAAAEAANRSASFSGSCEYEDLDLYG